MQSSITIQMPLSTHFERWTTSAKDSGSHTGSRTIRLHLESLWCWSRVACTEVGRDEGREQLTVGELACNRQFTRMRDPKITTPQPRLACEEDVGSTKRVCSPLRLEAPCTRQIAKASH